MAIVGRKKASNNFQVFINNPKSLKGKYSNLFKNNKKLFLEINSRDGEFIFNFSLSTDRYNFIGVENDSTNKIFFEESAKKFLKNGREMYNIKVIDSFNEESFLKFFEKREIQRIRISFPNIEQKFFFERKFLVYLFDILSYGGEMELLTYNKEIFDNFLLTIKKIPQYLDDENSLLKLSDNAYLGLYSPKTPSEVKDKDDGKRLFYFSFQKFKPLGKSSYL